VTNLPQPRRESARRTGPSASADSCTVSRRRYTAAARLPVRHSNTMNQRFKMSHERDRRHVRHSITMKVT